MIKILIFGDNDKLLLNSLRTSSHIEIENRILSSYVLNGKIRIYYINETKRSIYQWKKIFRNVELILYLCNNPEESKNDYILLRKSDWFISSRILLLNNFLELKDEIFNLLVEKTTNKSMSSRELSITDKSNLKSISF